MMSQKPAVFDFLKLLDQFMALPKDKQAVALAIAQAEAAKQKERA